VFVACSGGGGGDDNGGAASSSGGTGVDLTTTEGSTETGTTSETGTSSTGAGGAGVLDPLELCGGECACSNGIDDDGDGKVDGFDEECTGAADNDEGTFATGISGDNKDPKWQDCFFDGNSGAGDDGCRYATECLTGELPDDHRDCSVTESCIDFCAARTPNGCDCFGCCTVETSDGPVSIHIADTCDLEEIDDEEACPRCIPTEQCDNECGECELCPGKDELPETCDDDTPYCDDDKQPCDEENACPSGYFCQLGCCSVSIVIK
jgi:hypothetical protein